MWLHRENEYEWKYIGLWLDMLPEQVLSKVVNQNTDLLPESTLVLFKKYINKNKKRGKLKMVHFRYESNKLKFSEFDFINLKNYHQKIVLPCY